MLEAILILDKLNKAEHWEDYYPSKVACNSAIQELKELEDKSCNNCSINYQRCKIFISYWKSTETNTVEDSKCFYCMKHKFKESE